MIDVRKDVGKEVSVRKEDVEKGIVAIVGDRREGDDRRDRYSDRPARKVFTRRADGDGAPKSVYSKKKQIEYRKKNEGQETELRLNRYIAKGGVCSRRDADVLIAAGRVKVNGEVVATSWGKSKTYGSSGGR